MKAKKQAHSTRRPLKVNDCILSPAQAAAWRAANANQTARLPDRAAAEARLRALEAELAQAKAHNEVRLGLAETLALASARGEQVEAAPPDDPRRRIRISSRDGLETLARSGGITPVQFRAGMLYRDLYEATDPERDLRSQLSAPAFLGAGAARSATGVAEPWAARRVRLTGQISAIEAKVRRSDRDDRAVRALREVAGHARCVSHFVKGGGAQAAHRDALVLALDVVAGHFGLG